MKRPIPGNHIFQAVKDKQMIIMACNVRITKGILAGILKAAKKTDSAVIFELAASECNLSGGYTGLTPKDYARMTRKAATHIDFDIWALHGDHIKVKKGNRSEILQVKKLISAQIDAGYTSFAIDASHLFNFNGKNEREELEPNIQATTDIARYIKRHMKNKGFGLEVEVGEIGRKNSAGLVLTKPAEAVAYITALNHNQIYPDVLAIANGSTHGNIFVDGKKVVQTSIDIHLTKKVAAALRNHNFDVRLAQHGITGTPLSIIRKDFPRGDIIKGNVGTYWMNVFYSVIRKHEKELYRNMYEWTVEEYKNKGMSRQEIFGKYGKHAIKKFYDDIYSLGKKTERELTKAAYEKALGFFRAFHSQGSASLVRAYQESI